MRLVPLRLATSLLVLAVGVTAGCVALSAQVPSAEATPSAPVNLNTATAAQLETLPGIGPATAQRILDYREMHDGFNKIEELMNVRGIGEKTFLKLKPLVTVSPAGRQREAGGGTST